MAGRTSNTALPVLRTRALAAEVERSRRNTRRCTNGIYAVGTSRVCTVSVRPLSSTHAPGMVSSSVGDPGPISASGIATALLPDDSTPSLGRQSASHGSPPCTVPDPRRAPADRPEHATHQGHLIARVVHQRCQYLLHRRTQVRCRWVGHERRQCPIIIEEQCTPLRRYQAFGVRPGGAARAVRAVSSLFPATASAEGAL